MIMTDHGPDHSNPNRSALLPGAVTVEDLEQEPAVQEPKQANPGSASSRVSAEYATLLHDLDEAEKRLRRFEIAHVGELSIPDRRRMQLLLAKASAGPSDKAARQAESERCAKLRLLHLQSEYDEVATVASNLQCWLKEREEQPRAGGGGVETSYARGSEKLAMSVMHGMDTAIEILNEFGSCVVAP
jgi:hypothetical protein